MFSKKNLAVRFAVAVLVSSASFGGYVHAAETNPSGSNYANYVDDKENAGIADRAKSYDTELRTAKDSDGREYYTPESVSEYQKAAGINEDGKIGPETRWVAARAGGWSSGGSDQLMSPDFTFQANDVSPSKYRYDAGSKGNISMMFDRVSSLLLVAIATLAALLIAVAGLRMALSAGNTDEASKGKTMLKFNVMALAVALLSLAIVKLLTWIISAT